MDFANAAAGIPQLGFTHGGRFHADDVFSAALLRLLRPDIRIYRGYVVPKGFTGIVFDIGDGPYDHHAKDSPRRKNGVAYAAFGLLWRAFGGYLLGEEEAARFDEKFIQPLDLDDNCGTGNPVAALVAAFNPPWDSDEDEDAAFLEAVAVAQQLLYHRIKTIRSIERGRTVVEAALKNMQDGVVVLERFVPWKPVLVPSAAEFVVFPSPRGGVSVQCVPKEMTGKAGNKVPLPQAWRGRPAEELARVSGIPGLRFCHASGFMAATETQEAALAVCRAAKAAFLEAQEAARQRAAAEAGQKAAQGR